MVDFVAKRYGVLPTELLKSGSLVDLRCATLAVEYEAYLSKNPAQQLSHNMSTEDMIAQLNAVRSQNATSNK